MKLTLTGPNGKPVTDIVGAAVRLQTTSSAGAYSFCKLRCWLPVCTARDIDSTTVPTGFHLPTRTASGTTTTDSSLGCGGSTDLTPTGLWDLTLDFPGFWMPLRRSIEKLDTAGHDADTA